MSRTSSRVLAALALAGCCLGGCIREHHLDNYGRQSRAFFSRQHVQVVAADGSPSGLDSEEAALIKASYRRSLGEKEGEADSKLGSRVLLVEGRDDVPKKQ